MNELTQPPPNPSAPAQPPTSPPPQTPPETPAKIEYDRLVNYFDKLVKYSLLAITIILSIAAAFLWKNTEEVKNQAAASIRATQESATREISEIGKAAQTTAAVEAQKAIDAAFEKHNVQQIIERTAKTRVDAAVEEAVEKNLGARIEAFRSLINEIGEISNHGAQLRMGFRSGLDYLLKIRESSDPTVKAYASSTFKLIAADYEQAEANDLAAQNPAAGPYPNMTPKQLMQVIRTAQDPLGPVQIARAFYVMKNRVKWDVTMLDIPAAEKWCAEHKPACDQ
jgi:citrate lyase gamma subunit